MLVSKEKKNEIKSSSIIYIPVLRQTDLLNLVHLSIRGLHSDNQDSNNTKQSNNDKENGPTNSDTSHSQLKGEGITKTANMTTNYNARIQAILWDNSHYTMEQKNELIQELLLQMQRDTELDLLRQTQHKANHNFLVGSGPAAAHLNASNDNMSNNDNHNNNHGIANDNIQNNTNNNSHTTATQLRNSNESNPSVSNENCNNKKKNHRSKINSSPEKKKEK